MRDEVGDSNLKIRAYQVHPVVLLCRAFVCDLCPPLCLLVNPFYHRRFSIRASAM
jgi:hypothetical protein